MDASSFDRERLQHCAREIVAVGREIAGRGWTPATSGNFSMRLDARHIAMTASGLDKGRLRESDVLVVDLDGNAVTTDGQKPSAETLLHVRLYQRSSDIGCVLHTHSRTQTVASRVHAAVGHVKLEGYELLKALAGNSSHEMEVLLPILGNSQDMTVLAEQVDAWLDKGRLWGYLIERHGLYTWGRDVTEAWRHLEALEFLLECELEWGRQSK